MKTTWLVIAALLASGEATAQGPHHGPSRVNDGGAVVPVLARPIAVWDVGTSRESVAIAPNDTAFVSNDEAGAVDVWRNGRIEQLVNSPGEIVGISLDPNGGLLATGRTADGPGAVYAIDARGG